MRLVQIRSKRVSFARLPEPEALELLDIWAPVGSWEGIERCGRLHGLEVGEGYLPANDAGPIGSLSSLRLLTLSVDKGTVGLSSLSALSNLRKLRLTFDGDARGVDMSWVANLTALELLDMAMASRGPNYNIPLRALSAFPRLRDVELRGFYPAEGPRLFATGFEQLETLAITASSEADAAELYRLLPGRVSVHVRPDDVPLVNIGELDDGRWSTYVSFAELLEIDNNYEATDVAIARFDAAEPGLSARLAFDPEGGGTGVSAAREEDLRRVAEIVEGWMEA